MNSVSSAIFQSSFIKKSEKSKGFRKCMSFIDNNNKSSESCLPELTRPCLESLIRSAKVIRMPLSMAEDFWKTDPDVNVIHFVRDPRGMMLSRYALHHYKNLSHEAERTCKLMSFNHDYASKYAQEKPQRFIELKYEDLVLHTTAFVERLYNFLGLKVPDSLLQWLEVNMNTNDTSTYGTKRLSMQTAFKWKTSITPDEKGKIDNACSSALTKLGYTL